MIYQLLQIFDPPIISFFITTATNKEMLAIVFQEKVSIKCSFDLASMFIYVSH